MESLDRKQHELKKILNVDVVRKEIGDTKKTLKTTKANNAK